MKPIWVIEKDLWEREEELLFQLKWLGRQIALVSSDPTGRIFPDPYFFGKKVYHQRFGEDFLSYLKKTLDVHNSSNPTN